MKTAQISIASQISTSNVTIADLNEMKYNDLARFASQIGVKMQGLKKDLLLEECIKAITPEPVDNSLNIAEAKTRQDLYDAGLSIQDVAILLDGADIDKYDDVLDSVIERSGLEEEKIFRICGKIFDKEQALEKRKSSKSQQAIELYKQGKKLVEIQDILDMHPSFCYTVIDKYRKANGILNSKELKKATTQTVQE